MTSRILALALAVLGCISCAPFSDRSDLEQRVYEQDMRLRQIQPQQADTWNEVQAMREEIAQLKGQIAELNNAGGARSLADRVRQHDAALRQVDSNMALNLPLGAPMPAAGASEPVTGIQLNPGSAPDSSAYAAQAGTASGSTQPQPVSQQSSYGLPPEPVPTPVEAPPEEKWGQADPKPEVQETPKKDISLALFDAGVNDFNARKYSAAERSFRDFLKNYPSHTQTAEAQYYLAECLFQTNKFPDAALAYDEVIKKYPKSASAPKSYLKQGIAFSKMKQPAAAKQRMQELIRKYPNSAEAARAKTFLKTNK